MLGSDYSRSSNIMEGEMDGQVLVAYGTKHGATAEIAEKIGKCFARQA